MQEAIMSDMIECAVVERNQAYTALTETEKEAAYTLWVDARLREAEEDAKKPDAKWHTSEEMWKHLKNEFKDVL
jgi:hypothetical protein